MSKLPSFQFYTGDWLKDPALSACEPSTRGIWIDAIAAMHENSRSGMLSGSPGQLSRILRCSEAAFMAAIADLQATGTADVTVCRGNVTLINRRMAQEYKLREANRMRQKRHRNRDPMTEMSRSLSSTSSSTSYSKRIISAPAEPKQRGSPKRSLPENFSVTEDMRAWAAKSAPGIDLEHETERFLDYHKAKGSVFRDWTAAWRTWIGNARDWKKPQPEKAGTDWILDSGRTHGKRSSGQIRSEPDCDQLPKVSPGPKSDRALQEQTPQMVYARGRMGGSNEPDSS